MVSSNREAETKTNVWSTLLEQARSSERLGDGHMIILGEMGAGKRTLIRRLQQYQSREMELKRLPLGYTFLDGVPSHVKEDDFIAGKVNVWMLENRNQRDLLKVAFPRDVQCRKRCVCVLAIDLSRPWLIMDSLKEWVTILEEFAKKWLEELPVEDQDSLKRRVRSYLQHYKEVNGETSASIDHGSKDKIDPGIDLPLREGMLTTNLGIPLVVLACKSDSFATATASLDTDMRLEFIQRKIRQFCLSYGAALIYTSAKTGTNCTLFLDYVLHRLYFQHDNSTPAPLSSAFALLHRSNVVDRDGIFVPAGWDSKESIDALASSSKKMGWSPTDEFLSVIKAPSPATHTLAAEEESIDVKDEQTFLMKLLSKQKLAPDHVRHSTSDAAAAALKAFNANASTTTIRSSKPSPPTSSPSTSTSSSSANEPTPSSKPTSTTANVGEKLERRVTAQDAKENPALIANFFQSLLSREKPSFQPNPGEDGSSKAKKNNK